MEGWGGSPHQSEGPLETNDLQSGASGFLSLRFRLASSPSSIFLPPKHINGRGTHVHEQQTGATFEG
jgi:hypothetical protein